MVYRVVEDDTDTSIIKVYGVVSREKRERRALEALAGVEGVPKILNHGMEGDLAWQKMTDGGAWNLANLPKNLEVIEAAGRSSVTPIRRRQRSPTSWLASTQTMS